ncbi:hypothetical protein PIB30_014136 [Stylosanthes scabra]|uniref:Ribonuclease H1 N-terminal domain-containing protein n=1 Tax=Stylosanthes scabra TaxID=79078 RepID=A0ABU6T6B8_9FABA|nr:hypothetical protein [Stylosanthes scabra]
MVECYVVFAGRNPGSYASWPAAAREVVGFNGSIYQRYPTWKAGLEAWNSYHGVPTADADHDGSNAGVAEDEGVALGGNDVGLGVEEPGVEAVNVEADVARASSSAHSRVSTETEVDGPAGDGGAASRHGGHRGARGARIPARGRQVGTPALVGRDGPADGKVDDSQGTHEMMLEVMLLIRCKRRGKTLVRI